MATQGISFKQFSRLAPHVLRTRKPMMGHGRHGIGKSELVYQLGPVLQCILGLDKDKSFVKKYGKKYNYPIIERRASQMADTGDIIGIPKEQASEWGCSETVFAPMAWFLRGCFEPVILFCDELDRGSKAVRQAFMEMTDSRKIAGFTLHPDTIVISMVNGGAHDTNNSYQVGELDPAEHDRWWHVNLEPTVEDWLDWAKGKVLDVTWDFYKQNPDHLEYSGDIDPHKVYPSRRSAFQYDKCLQDAKRVGQDLLVPDENNKIPMDAYFLGEGFIGQEASLAFKDFVDNYNKQVTVEDIFAGRKKQLVKNFKVNDSNAMIDKIAACDKIINNKLNEKEVENLAKFLYTIQAELAMKAWEKLTAAGKQEGAETVKKFWKIEVAPGVNFGGYIAQIVGDEATEE